MNWVKTMRNTVNCPYCGTGYTFTSETRRQDWIAGGRKAPLHLACKKAAKEEILQNKVLTNPKEGV